MKHTQLPPESNSNPKPNAPSSVLQRWTLAALAANAVLLAVIALQINQVGNKLTDIAGQKATAASYSDAIQPESPYQVSFAKNEANYSAYRVSNSDPIPVRIVGTPLPVEIKDEPVRVIVDNDSWDPVPVKMDRK